MDTMSIIIEILILILAVYIYRKTGNLQAGMYEIWRALDTMRKDMELIKSRQTDKAPEKEKQPVETPRQTAPTPPIQEATPTMPAYVPPVPKATTTPPPLPKEHMHAEPDRPEKPATERTDSNMERMIGINLFSKIGIIVLIVGIGFFVKYAIDKE